MPHQAERETGSLGDRERGGQGLRNPYMEGKEGVRDIYCEIV